ncbi:MAG: adenylosuccinate synthase [Candidatus Cloacimonetes bacterium]|nr:adenylosuccinate synthase [Candidatus Cloacimonadota bacterium]
MSSTAILGCMWGDEAKAKIVDVLGANADIVVRFQGGSNAGHTIIIDNDKYILHMVPSGIVNPKIICVIAPGVVLNPFEMIDEMQGLKERGVDFSNRLLIDPRANLVLDLHKDLDCKSEQGTNGNKIGTTKRGIGPAYADAVARTGLKIYHLYDEVTLKSMLIQIYQSHDRNLTETELKEIVEELQVAAEYLKPYVKQTPYYLNEQIKAGKEIIFEGAQGSLLDITYGSYPYVTSSHTVSGGISIGCGVPPNKINKIIGVYKSYFTRVGEGPFPTELLDKTGDQIRTQGHEFGSTTGRPRRCGWFDAVASGYTAMLNGVDEMALTLLDVLTGVGDVKICTGYKYKDEIIKEFPAEVRILAEVEPVYEEMPGWEEDISSLTEFDALPQNAKNYIKRIEELLGIPATIISVGPDRKQTIFR